MADNVGLTNKISYGPGNEQSIESGVGLVDPVGVGAIASSTYITVREEGDNVVHKTTLTLDALPVSVVGATGVGFGGALAYTFPEGRINVLGVTASLSIDVLSSNLEAADGGDFGIGTAIVADADLGDATDIDLCPTTSIDPIGTAVGAALVASAQFDGTSTAKTVNVNILIDDADIGGTEAIGVDGTITITWINHGDY